MSSSRASTRISIRWLPEPASEPTDTLVLSVGGYFVDVRITLSDQTLDWALAGRRVVLSEDPLKVEFDSHVDSHRTGHEPDSHHADVGSFSTLPNGDDLETGEMPAAHLDNKMTPYEEVWRVLDARMPDTTKETKSVTVAWVLESVPKVNSSTIATWYARVGRFFLGVRQRVVEGNFVYDAIREDWDESSLRWRRRYAVGNPKGLRYIGDGHWDEIVIPSVRVGGTLVLSSDERYLVRALE